MPVLTEKIRKSRLRNFIIAYVAVFVALAFFGQMYVEERHAAVGVQNPLMMQKIVSDLAYCDLPRISVSMNMGGAQGAPRLRADVSLEVARKDYVLLQSFQPRISERLSDLLSSVTMEDLQSKGALPKLRADMLKAANNAGAPVPVHDLVFRELVIM